MIKTVLPAGSGGEAEGTFKPQLTSLVDVMTILLVFLIKSFSTDGNIVTPSDDLELPVSTSEVAPSPRCAIEITRKAVMAEGEVLATLESIAASDSLIVPSLYSWMRLQLSRRTDTLTQPQVMIQCDREIEFSCLKKVMFTCSKAGFVDYSVLVLQEE